MATASLESRSADGTDPGAVDNRLSLDPSHPDWKDEIEDWEDGEEYDLKVKVRQLSPGEFEVLEVKPQGDEESSDEEGEDEDAEEEPVKGKGYTGKVSKPVRGMMEE